MIRWNYLLPRLVILILLILSIRIAANPVFKTILTASLETMFNARKWTLTNLKSIFPTADQHLQDRNR